MLRTALLGGNGITLDADLSKYIETLSDQGVIEGLEVNSNSVAAGKAWVKATRSNGETIMVLVQNTEALAVDTSGTKKIWLEIRQEAIDNGALNNEDGTGIAEIKTGPSVPSQNSLLLASVAGGMIKDEKNLIPKIQSVAQKTSTLEEKMESAEGQISQLVEAGTPSYLGITGIVGEKYTMEDTLFLQKTPTLEDSTIAINVGDIDKNKEIHIQRIGSGTASNQLKLKMKKFGAPTTSVVVEVRKGVKVDVSDKEAYRYGGEVVATATIAYTEFLTDWKEFTLTLNNQFGGTKGELLDIVVYQQGRIVNGTNYYQLAYDNTQYSEAFSYVSVNGSSRVREKLMPYCVSDGFFSELTSKVKNFIEINTNIDSGSYQRKNGNSIEYDLVAASTGKYRITAYFHSGYGCAVRVYVGGVEKVAVGFPKGEQNGTFDFDAKKGDIIKLNVSVSVGDCTLYNGKLYLTSYVLLSEGNKIFPRSQVNIGAIIKMTSFGEHIDQSRKGHQIDTGLTTSATTGAIPPANAVGYMSIIGADGKKYKIRVYGE